MAGVFRVVVMTALFGCVGFAVAAFADTADADDSDLVCLESARKSGRQFVYIRASLPASVADRVGAGELAEKPCERDTLVARLAGTGALLVAPECSPPSAERQAFCDGTAALSAELDQALAALDGEPAPQ